jgi:rhodanese-related sulfurtransferase
VTHPRVSAREAHQLLSEHGYSYLDVRTQREFALGHPEGAFNIPLQCRNELTSSPNTLSENPDFVAVARSVFAPDRKLIIGCHSGTRSHTAAQLLLAAGYCAIVEQRAGYEGTRDAFGRIIEHGWRQSNLPSATDALPGHDYASLLQLLTPERP